MENLTNNELKTVITSQLSENLIYYRKKAKLTQLELAEKLNYSDKSISKWERGEGVPDIFVLKELSILFGIPVDQLISKRRKSLGFLHNREILSYFYASIVWLIASIIFVVVANIDSSLPAWSAFVHAIPISALILLVFNIVWRKKIRVYIYTTILIWSGALSLEYIFSKFDSYWVFILAIPIYIFTTFLLYVVYRPKIKI